MAKTKEMVNEGKMAADLRGSLLRVYGATNGVEGLEKLQSMFTASTMSEEQRQCLMGMPCGVDEAKVINHLFGFY